MSQPSKVSEKTYNYRTPKQIHDSLRQTWCSMVRSCYNPKDDSYKYNGARGIRVCDRWRCSFDNFFDDMGPRTTPKHVLSRIDGDGDFTPSNCRWATRKEHVRHSRTAYRIACDGEIVSKVELVEKGCTPEQLEVYKKQKVIHAPPTALAINAERLTFQGRTMLYREWAEEMNIGVETLYDRIKVRGWSVEEALMTPSDYWLHRFEYQGQTKTIEGWAADSVVSRRRLYVRLVLLGWPMERALNEPPKPVIEAKEYTYQGETLTLRQWAKRVGMKYGTLYARIHFRKWSFEDALITPLFPR